MLNLQRVARLLDRAFPSVPPADQAIILAAMEGRDLQTPVPTSLGEGNVGAGQVSVSPFQVHGTDNPEGVAPAHPAAPSGPPASETDLFWEPAPERRWEFTAGRLGDLLDRWEKETSA